MKGGKKRTDEVNYSVYDFCVSSLRVPRIFHVLSLGTILRFNFQVPVWIIDRITVTVRDLARRKISGFVSRAIKLARMTHHRFAIFSAALHFLMRKIDGNWRFIADYSQCQIYHFEIRLVF